MIIPVFRIAAKNRNFRKPERTKQPKFYPQEMWMLLALGGLRTLQKS